MLDQIENQGYDLVVSISFDLVARHGNGRGNNNCNNNNVSKGNNNKGSIEAMQGEQLLLNYFLKILTFMGCLNLNSKYEVSIKLISKLYIFLHSYVDL
jgi:hypothetical protein